MKKAVKALAALLAVCFCFSALIVAADAAASDVEEGKLFEFGMYPQTHVTDAGTIEKLNTLRGIDNSEVIKLNGVTYASIRLATEGFKPGGSPFGYYYKYYPYDEEHGYETYWFRFEPISWRVLDSGSDAVLLMAENVLCTHAYNEAVRADNTWENSDVRKWLNNTFLKTAFTSKERSYLLDYAATNEDNPVYGSYNGSPSSYMGETYNGYPYQGTESGNDTVDKVFLPSFREITNWEYGFNVGWKDKKGDYGEPVGYYETDTLPGEHCARSTTATDYAKCQGAWTNLIADVNGVYRLPVDTCRYWLRTAGFDSTRAAGVLEDGRVSTGWSVDYNIVGVRPMICVAPDAVAEGVVSNPDEENLPFHIITPYSTFHYKQRNIKLEADTEVTWKSSDPQIASINAETGEVTIHRVGTVTITATSKATGETVEFKMEIVYLWWQQMIRIFLFGWIWY